VIVRFTAGLLLLLLFLLGSATASSEPQEQQEESIVNQVQLAYEVKYMENLHLRINTGTIDTQLVDDPQIVQAILTILQNVPWENAWVSMTRLPDYNIVTINTDPAVSYERAVFEVWLTPQGDQLEISIQGKGQYGIVSKEDSSKLLAIIKSP
jgi:hypothetical protein